MKKNIIKTLFLSFLLFFSIAFINIDGVKAEGCKCFYMGGSEYTNSSGIQTASYYWVEIYYSDTEATVKHACSQDMQYNLPNDSSWILNSKNVGCTTKSFDRGSPFNVDSGYISNNNCSKDACNSANIYIKQQGAYKTKIVSSSGNYKLNAVDKAFYDKRQQQQEQDQQNADNAPIDDIDPAKVKNWANNDATETVEAGTASCDLIPKSIIEFLNNLFLIIQVIGVLLAVILSGLEFVKAITGSDEDGLKGAIKNTFRRIIVVVILLILPAIVIWILNIINDNRYEKDNGNYVIGENGNPVCK